jgi:hypothetical protein
MSTQECIASRIEYLMSELNTVNDIELKTPFEYQLAEYLWDEICKANNTLVQVNADVVRADQELYDEVGADVYQLIKMGR